LRWINPSRRADADHQHDAPLEPAMHDLLVHATRHDAWEPAVAYAMRLAAGLRASLTALYVPAGAPMAPVAGPETAFVEYLAGLAEETGDACAAASRFEAWAGSMGVVHCEWLVAPGNVGAVLHYAAAWHDLLVLGADGADPWRRPGGLSEVLLRSNRPCLVVPESAADGDVRHACIAVAWNGAVEAIRAVHAARPLLAAAQRVVVLDGGEPAPEPSRPAFRLHRWCVRHGIRIERRPLPAGADEGGPILDAARDAGAQLLVMGAYGRSRITEWALGGVTRHMLRHSPLPLFLHH
jgi:nucleotide-binding universal stress UspA family protein